MAKKPPASRPKAAKKPASGISATKVHETEIVDENDFSPSSDLDASEPPGIGGEKVFPTDKDLEEAAREAQRLVKEDALLPISPSHPHVPANVDPLAAYLSEIRRYPLLTPEQEREIATEFRATGNPRLAQKLVTSNLRFVVKIAAEYSRFGSKMIDLIQEGNVGLMQAVKEFNPQKGVRLITYAVWWIRGYMREYLMKQYSMVRVGTTHGQKKLFYNLQSAENRQRVLGGEELNAAQISHDLGVSEKDVEIMRARMSGRDVSLDQPMDEASKATLMDFQTSPDDVGNPEIELQRSQEISLVQKKVAEIRPNLNEKETYILDRRILSDDPMTLQEIGDDLGITRERTRQIENRVFEKLREVLAPGASGANKSSES